MGEKSSRASRFRGAELRAKYVARARLTIEKALGRALNEKDIRFFKDESSAMDQGQRVAENAKQESKAKAEKKARQVLVDLIRVLQTAQPLLDPTTLDGGTGYYLFALRSARGESADARPTSAAGRCADKAWTPSSLPGTASSHPHR